jgi:diaminopimelate epimerase
MNLKFTKMHGLGNDFVVFNAIDQRIDLDSDALRRIADRHFGIGCDQILLIESPRTADTDFHYRIFNADGGEVEQCGNGARCFARYVRDAGLSDKDEIAVGTQAGRIVLHHEADGNVRVDMGVPILEPEKIPFLAPELAASYALDAGGESLSIGAVSMGNPHAVLRVGSVDKAPVAQLGPMLEKHPRFPQRVNVGFMEIRSSSHIRLRVYERGAGETLACGTGACAAVVVGRTQGDLDADVVVELRGGNLRVQWPGRGQPVLMSGPATRVYEGTIALR